ncbi:UV DNA damage repair endonuclease UvsE [Senegalia massiliensis]|uniref:UV DNA damage repair endonuclease UvsE n=1 Tax=Senegalia massiliensis TaxID=1720316 RepID=UPI00102F9843|nr:UV DNA damage repair endonuclease UvsE [Senegalia massiliensis]
MISIKIGYACINKSINRVNFKTCRLKNASQQRLKELIKYNLESLEEILNYNKEKNINMYRISSDIIPFASHDVNNIDWELEFKTELNSIKSIINNNNFRVSMHPGQYTVLNSKNQDVVLKSVKELNYHAKFLDAITDDFTHKIVLHIGGVYGDKRKAIIRFIENFNLLSTSVKKRLIIENDDKNYTIEEVIYISEKLKIPIVFDNLHNEINGNYNIFELFKKIYYSWKNEDGIPKFHYSQQAPYKRIGSHTQTIEPFSFLKYINKFNYDIDIMLEVKDKNLSVEKIMNLKADKLNIIRDEWGKYKYNVMKKSYNEYKRISKYINSENPSWNNVCTMLESSFNKQESINEALNAYMHIWGYFKNLANDKEKRSFLELINKSNNASIDSYNIEKYLFDLTEKYNVEYLLNSYFFNDIN